MDVSEKRKRQPNPRENANPLSIITFFYTLPTFFQGYKNEFTEDALYETVSEHQSEYLGDKLEANWNRELQNAKLANREPSLRKALIKTFGLSYMMFGLVVAFIEIPVKLSQPLALGQLIAYYGSGGEPKISDKEAYLYAGAVVGCSLIAVLLNHPYMMAMLHTGMKVRVACCSLIYRKSLKLSKTALGQTTVGQVVNLLSNDVNRFDFATVFLHHLWVAPLQTSVALYFMYQQVEISAVIGVSFLILFIPLQFLLGKLSSRFRLRTAIRTDERVRLMNEIIMGIQVIKMYTWEKPFAKLVAFTRRYEVKAVRAASYIKGIYTSFIMFTTRTALFLTVLSYVLFDNSINAQQVFILTAFYNTLRQSMTVFFPQGIAVLAETGVSIRRLTKYLLYEELKTPITSTIPNLVNEKDEKSKTENALTIHDGSAKWLESSTENTLNNVYLNIKKGSLVAVIGPVGSGKTSLLHTILRELPLTSGSLSVNGELSYASQEPWLFTGSVRQNILFGKEIERLRYKTVVNRCALERDFTLLPYADKTIVGERGISLSGGQRARINLARAVYKDADIYLLDDPLSAVDTHVGKQLFEKCIREFLREKTVILITHQLQYLKDVDYIVIIEDGIIKAEGTFEELQSSGLDFAKLLQSEMEQTEEEQTDKQSLSRQTSIQKRSSVISTNSTEGQAPKQVQEQRGSGTVSGAVYMAYIKASGNWCAILSLLLLLLLTQIAASLGDVFITHWTNLEQERAENTSLSTLGYIDSGIFLNTFAHTNDTELLQNWHRSDSGDSFLDFTTEESIYIYSGITVALVCLALIRSVAFFSLCMNASVRLHDKMFGSLIHAIMRFFNTNTSGRILNRFSKDIGSVDERLPPAMVDVTQIALSLIAIVIVISTVNVWLVIPTLVIGVIFYFLRIFYMSTSRMVKRLEGVTRSPVFAHLSASLQGLTTIRAFGAQSILAKEFDNHQDLHSSSWFIYISISTAFGYTLDLICIIYITLVTFSFFVIGNETFGGNVGLAITQSLALTGMFQWGMRQTTELENQMTSVERVLEYTELENEPPLESAPNKKPPKTWPEHGEIKFVNMFLKYFPEDPPVLKNLNFTINPLEKVGIVGRTGAGKSSLIAALFRLTDMEGSILIDNVDSKDIGLHDLRSKISIIPQEPVLFSGTMRRNLDPFDEYSDEVLWKSLEEVELKDVVADMPSGLNTKMSEGGSNFSVGQRQLVCLARAIIRNNKILVLDEATANVDPQTDALIQHTIRKKFADCTVLTIAHRLHTVMDSDKVLVMDAGTMVEFDHPHILLQDHNGVFYGMVQQTGKTMAETLIKVSENNYNKLQTRKSIS